MAGGFLGLSIACGPSVLLDPVAGSSSTGGPTSEGSDPPDDTGPTPPTPLPTTVGPMTTTTTTTGMPNGSSGSSGPDDPTTSFIVPPDGGPGGAECDLWQQDCPRGTKCMPWANDGGNSWNATKCTPIVPDPDGPGEPCTVERSGVSGIDSCELAAMCWNVDAEGQGECVPMCEGSPSNPECSDPNRYCAISGDAVLILCLNRCDLLLQNCPRGSGCYLTADEPTCAPDASGELGMNGDPCEYINACDPGLVCALPEATPGCTSSGCCTPFCDLNLANDCPGSGQLCIPLFAPDEAPPGNEDVGFCSAEL